MYFNRTVKTKLKHPQQYAIHILLYRDAFRPEGVHNVSLLRKSKYSIGKGLCYMVWQNRYSNPNTRCIKMFLIKVV